MATTTTGMPTQSAAAQVRILLIPSKFSNTVILDGHTKTGTVYGSASIEENAEIPEGYTLTIESGKTLTIPADGTLINNGTIFCYGTINGNVVGDVRYPAG